MVSVLLGVTIFGINFTNHSVKAATTESVKSSNSSPETQGSAATANNSIESATTPQSAPNTQGSASKNATANNSIESATTLQSSPETQGSAATANNPTESATTSQSAPKTQGSAHTDIKSSTAKSAAKLAFMNLMATSGTGTNTDTGTNTGTDRNAAGTVDQNNINTQLAKENQELANKHNLTSSDNYSSNIYKGTDGKYYKIVTIYGNDYVYRAADIQANGTAFLQKATTAADTKNNIDISKEDLGNGQTRWTVVFFPHKGLQNVGSNLSGLTSAKFGIALTSDYQIVGNVDMDVISDPNQTFMSHTFEPGSSSATDWPVQNPPAVVDFSFNPKTDVDPNTGLINNSKTLPAYNNKYLQPSYYFTTATTTGAINLWQTYFFNHRNDVKYYNAYDGSPYLGYGHDFHFNNFEIKNTTGVDGAKFGDKIIYDKLGYRLNSKNGVANSNGVVNSDNFNQAMEFKSQGSTGNSQTQFSSYVISFTTQHTDSHEVELATGWKNQQFSGISANIYSYQNTGYYNMFSRLYGEQRALTPADAADPYAPVNPKDIIPNWVPANEAIGQIKKDYLNNAQINVLRNKILNNITDPDAVKNIIKEGNSLNDAMKNLGNSIGQYDPDGSFADHKVDKTKASDRYQYADSDKKSAYDTATDAVSNIISVENGTVNKNKGTYADQATVEQLTKDENKAWNELNGVLANKITPNIPTTKVPVADTSNLTGIEKGEVKKNVEEANKGNFPDGTKVDVGADGTATITYPDKSTDTIPGRDLVRPKTDAEKITPNTPATKVPVADTSNLTGIEKGEVKKSVEDANKGNFPDGTKVDVGNDGTATITYPDKTTDTIPGRDLVRPATEAEKITPNIPATKVPVADTSNLTDTENGEVKKNVEEANKGNFPDGTKVDVGNDGTATITYPDKTTDTIPGRDLVRPENDADKNDPKGPKNPDDRVPVKDPNHLTDGDKDKVKGEVGKVNPDLPEGTEVTVDDKGNATIKYPDGSKDTIPGGDLVRPENDADKNDPKGPKNPDDRVPVKDPNHLTDGDKDKVKGEVGKVNPDLPEGTEVTVDDKGNATIKYPDGSKDTISGGDLVRPEKDADNITPNIPGDKVTVKDPSHLTDDEKNQVKNNVDNANKDKFPAGTVITVGDDGTATITYPDTSTDTIPGDKLVKGEDSGSTSGQTDAGNITPTIPGGKVTVKDPSHLTDDEKSQVKNNVDNANKDKFPAGTEVTVGDDGTTTVTYPDGTKDTIPGDQLVQGQKGDTTDAGNITPTVPGDKATVKDPSHLTDSEKDQVKKNVEDANKDKFPDGTKITVGDDGTATVTYPDGSKDVIAGTDLVIAAKGEDVLGSKYHSHKNGSNSSQADRVKGASTANGSIANAGNNLGVKGESDNAIVGVKAESDNAFVGVKGESDNAIGNNKATSLKTLPQTGTKDTSILGVLGMLLASLGLFVFKKKRDEK